VAAQIKGKSVAQLAAMLHAGAVDAEELALQTVEAIADCDDQAIFTTFMPNRALNEARAASSRRRNGMSLGMLDGIPVAWKDNFDFEGEITTAGARVLADSPPALRDAAAVDHLKRAGMVNIGHLNMSELAFSGIGINPHYGTPRNAWSRNVPRVPGGSSSGSGVAVAKGLVPVAIGTDTGGSVRVPAAYNGVVGYKASRSRYDLRGVYPLAKSLDSIGPICNSVQDVVMVDSALRRQPVLPSHRYRQDGVRLLVPTNIVLDDLESGVATAFDRALQRLSAAGVLITNGSISAFDKICELTKQYGALMNAEVYAQHSALLNGPMASLVDHRVVTRAKLGASVTAASYRALCAAREMLISETVAHLGSDIIVAYPTIPQVAPPIAPLESDVGLFFQANARSVRNVAFGNFLDWCSLTVPCGHGEADMPVGLLLSGPSGHDDRLLAFAATAETAIRGDFLGRN
jgi:aspartyl-tRNA(Asn)/glutamyl-tRNA(Gln) amidotransferase subunit A